MKNIIKHFFGLWFQLLLVSLGFLLLKSYFPSQLIPYLNGFFFLLAVFLYFKNIKVYKFKETKARTILLLVWIFTLLLAFLSSYFLSVKNGENINGEYISDRGIYFANDGVYYSFENFPKRIGFDFNKDGYVDIFYTENGWEEVNAYDFIGWFLLGLLIFFMLGLYKRKVAMSIIICFMLIFQFPLYVLANDIKYCEPSDLQVYSIGIKNNDFSVRYLYDKFGYTLYKVNSKEDCKKENNKFKLFYENICKKTKNCEQINVFNKRILPRLANKYPFMDCINKFKTFGMYINVNKFCLDYIDKVDFNKARSCEYKLYLKGIKPIKADFRFCCNGCYVSSMMEKYNLSLNDAIDKLTNLLDIDIFNTCVEAFGPNDKHHYSVCYEKAINRKLVNCIKKQLSLGKNFIKANIYCVRNKNNLEDADINNSNKKNNSGKKSGGGSQENLSNQTEQGVNSSKEQILNTNNGGKQGDVKVKKDGKTSNDNIQNIDNKKDQIDNAIKDAISKITKLSNIKPKTEKEKKISQKFKEYKKTIDKVKDFNEKVQDWIKKTKGIDFDKDKVKEFEETVKKYKSLKAKAKLKKYLLGQENKIHSVLKKNAKTYGDYIEEIKAHNKNYKKLSKEIGDLSDEAKKLEDEFNDASKKLKKRKQVGPVLDTLDKAGKAISIASDAGDLQQEAEKSGIKLSDEEALVGSTIQNTLGDIVGENPVDKTMSTAGEVIKKVGEYLGSDKIKKAGEYMENSLTLAGHIKQAVKFSVTTKDKTLKDMPKEYDEMYEQEAKKSGVLGKTWAYTKYKVISKGYYRGVVGTKKVIKGAGKVVGWIKKLF